MPKVGYSISNIEKIFSRMIESDTFPTKSQLADLQKEVNKFFTEANCLGVMYTRNTDNLFFGMAVMPVFTNAEVLEIIADNNPIKVKKYYLELDSKLFTIDLSAREITAVLLHEIGHLVTDDKPIKAVRYAIDKYFAKRDKTISLKNSAQYTKLISFAINDTIYKFTSILYANDDEVKADAFVSACGYGDELVAAEMKIASNAWGLNKSAKAPKLVILDWVFHLYTNVKFNRIPAMNTLKSAKRNTGSVLKKKELDSVIDALNKIDTDVVNEAASLLEGFSKKKGLAWQIKQNGLKGIQNDFYEFKIRSKNAREEADILYLMRQINARMSLLRDAIDEGDMTEQEKEKWLDLLFQYGDLRNTVSNLKVSNRSYGLWYDYSQLDDIDREKYERGY